MERSNIACLPPICRDVSVRHYVVFVVGVIFSRTTSVCCWVDVTTVPGLCVGTNLLIGDDVGDMGTMRSCVSTMGCVCGRLMVSWIEAKSLVD